MTQEAQFLNNPLFEDSREITNPFVTLPDWILYSFAKKIRPEFEVDVEHKLDDNSKNSAIGILMGGKYGKNLEPDLSFLTEKEMKVIENQHKKLRSIISEANTIKLKNRNAFYQKSVQSERTSPEDNIVKKNIENLYSGSIDSFTAREFPFIDNKSIPIDFVRGSVSLVPSLEEDKEAGEKVTLIDGKGTLINIWQSSSIVERKPREIPSENPLAVEEVFLEKSIDEKILEEVQEAIQSIDEKRKSVSLKRLRELSRLMGLSIGGSKNQLVDRIRKKLILEKGR